MPPQESYATEEAVHNAGNYDAQKTARLAELEELLEAHKREVANLTQQVSHWRGLVERYGGNTTEILELEEREKREGASEGAVGKSLEEQLRLNEELQRGAFSTRLSRLLSLTHLLSQNSTRRETSWR